MPQVEFLPLVVLNARRVPLTVPPVHAEALQELKASAKIESLFGVLVGVDVGV